MSAFIVGDEQLQKIVAFLARGRHQIKWTLKNEIEPLGFNLVESEGDRSRFGTVLRDLNAEAVFLRYPRDTEAGDVWRETTYPYCHRDVSPPAAIPALKLIRCWLYQCNESDSLTESALFQSVRLISGELASEIVLRTPEGEAAAWG